MKTIFLLPAALFSALLSGCSALNPGEEHFACSGMPGSVYCHSARDVYNKTNSGLVPSPIRSNTYNPDCVDCVRAEDVNPELGVGSGDVGQGPQSKAIDKDEVINNYVTPNLSNRPVPVRTPSQVMRIWVGPYVDTSGDLVVPGIVYTEIEPRRWIYPNDMKALNNRVMTPLQDHGRYVGGSTDVTLQAGTKQGAEIRHMGAVTTPEFSALEKYRAAQQEFVKRMKH